MACQNGRCTRCNSCQGCNNCQKCNTKCQVTCNDNNLQTLCNTKGQSYSANAGTFSWKNCATKGQIIGPGYFDQDEWDRIISHINKARNAGRKVSTGGAISKSTKADVSPFSAKEFNRVARKVGNITVTITENGETVTKTNATANDIIYGTYFSKLETAANTMRISSNACDVCNASCDGGCDKCQKCNTKCDSNCNGSAQASYSYTCCSCEGVPCQTCQDTCLINQQRAS